MTAWARPNSSGEIAVGRIPIRNLWFLYLHALDLGAFVGRYDAAIDGAADWPHLLVDLFTQIVERRLHRGASRGYIERRATISRLRGRLDMLATEVGHTLDRGAVACRFEELTYDTPRNRYVRETLDFVPRLKVRRDLADRCHNLSHRLGALGVTVTATTATLPNRETYGRNDAEDRLMIELARLVRDLAHPSDDAGSRRLPSPIRDEVELRKVFERATANFLKKRLADSGWRVAPQQSLSWRAAVMSEGLSPILPSMVVDIALENADAGRRIVIDTKYAAILSRGRFDREVLKSGYLYQIYTYLRTQEDRGGIHAFAEGVLLHPSVGADIDESMHLDRHSIRLLTVDLAQSRDEIETRLMAIVDATEAIKVPMESAAEPIRTRTPI